MRHSLGDGVRFLIMFYVYLLKSIHFPSENYVGITSDINERLSCHNSGGSVHTAKYKPWEMVVYVHFNDEKRAREFEKYLKSGSGRAFMVRHFW